MPSCCAPTPRAAAPCSIIDEAQSLAPDVLEQLRLLTNLETAERKLLQIILIGQPELREMLARPDLEQLAQRVIARYHLGPLSREETAPYIRHRLSVAGAQAQMPFEPAALASIHRLTGGVPRRINLLADRALLGAYAHQRAKVDRRMVEQAAREVFGRPATVASTCSAGPAWAIGAGVALVGGAGGGCCLGGLVARRHRCPRPRAAAPAASSAPRRHRRPRRRHRRCIGRLDGVGGHRLHPRIRWPAASAVDAPAGGRGDAVRARGSHRTGCRPTPPPCWPRRTPSEATAWRELALHWNVAIGEGDACTAAAQARLMCFRSAAGGLPVVRHLDRPGIVALRGADDRPRWALLVGLSDSQVDAAGGRSSAFSLRCPRWPASGAASSPLSGARRRAGARASMRSAEPGDARLGGMSSSTPPACLPAVSCRHACAVFQLAQGLPPDGLAGPMTLMRLNRSAGVDEPSLEGVP